MRLYRRFASQYRPLALLCRRKTHSGNEWFATRIEQKHFSKKVLFYRFQVIQFERNALSLSFYYPRALKPVFAPLNQPFGGKGKQISSTIFNNGSQALDRPINPSLPLPQFQRNLALFLRSARRIQVILRLRSQRMDHFEGRAII